uniref:EAL domain-containing protein n=1 Tax=Steinernema glaseri TaxID=37863 RepID=A0A1I7ZSN3_9BILA
MSFPYDFRGNASPWCAHLNKMPQQSRLIRRHATMDRVPILFIEEVMLQFELIPSFLEGTPLWASIADSKRSRKGVFLYVYLVNDKEAVFSVLNFAFPEPLVNLVQFGISYITIMDGNKGMLTDSRFHLLTKTNFKLLRNCLRRGHPCTMHFDVIQRKNHPLVQKLCWAASRITKISFSGQTCLPIEALTRILERGTLRVLESSNFFNVTHEALPFLLKFVASEHMTYFCIDIATNSPVSYNALLSGVVDAFLSVERGRRFRLEVDCGTSGICERLGELVMEGKVSIVYSSIKYDAIMCSVTNPYALLK